MKRKPKETIWEFTPAPDITAYELAVIVKHTLGSLKNHIVVRADNPIPADLSRHFTEVP